MISIRNEKICTIYNIFNKCKIGQQQKILVIRVFFLEFIYLKEISNKIKYD